MSPPRILACRPTELDKRDPMDRKIMQETFVYAGSVKSTCENCGRGIWLGPRQQVALLLTASKMCFKCAVVTLSAAGGTRGDVMELGNPERGPN